jgi:hypothetical protein
MELNECYNKINNLKKEVKELEYKKKTLENKLRRM